MAVKTVTRERKYARYFVERVVFDYEEDNSVKLTTTYWSLETKNTSVGLAPDFDAEKWGTAESIPKAAKLLKEVSTEDGTTFKVTGTLRYYYEWYSETEEALEHVKGVCVNCMHHTTENPYYTAWTAIQELDHVCGGRQQVISRNRTERHWCMAYVKSDYIAGKDVYDDCREHNSHGECTKYAESEEHEEVSVGLLEITQDGNTVSISCATEGASLLYTTDGTDPVTNGTEYTEPFEIAETVTVHAVAVKDGTYSKVAEKECVYTEPVTEVDTPVIAFANNDVTITCETDDATIYYTMDGTEPTAESEEYNGFFAITETATVKAVAIKNGVSSDVAEKLCEFAE